MKTSLKTGVAQIFPCCPPKTGELKKFARGGGPASPLGIAPCLYAPLNESKKDKLFFKQLRSSYLLG